MSVFIYYSERLPDSGMVHWAQYFYKVTCPPS